MEDFVEEGGKLLANNVYIANIVLLLLTVGMLFFIGYAIYMTVKNEKRRARYTSEIKSGDNIYFSVMSGSVNATVQDIDDEFVNVVVRLRKNQVYPRENGSV